MLCNDLKKFYKWLFPLALTCIDSSAFANEIPSTLQQQLIERIDFSSMEHPQWSIRRQTFQSSLNTIAEELIWQHPVPYVWGGDRLGDEQSCARCTQCIRRSSVDSHARKKFCQECRSCGIDCSHFVHLVFKVHGMDFPYLNSWVMENLSPSKLFHRYGFIVVEGRDLSRAEVGDVLVYEGHVGILTKKSSTRHGDILHASRLHEEHGTIGGIRFDRERNLSQAWGGLKKILRHRQLSIEGAWTFYPALQREFSDEADSAFTRAQGRGV